MILTHLVLFQFFPGAANGTPAPPPPVTATRRPGWDEREAIRLRILREDRDFIDMLAVTLPFLDD